MKSGIGRFRKEKGMEKKSREIRAAPPAPCSKKTECKGRVFSNPACEDWRIYRNKYLIKG